MPPPEPVKVWALLVSPALVNVVALSATLNKELFAFLYVAHREFLALGRYDMLCTLLTKNDQENSMTSAFDDVQISNDGVNTCTLGTF